MKHHLLSIILVAALLCTIILPAAPVSAAEGEVVLDLSIAPIKLTAEGYTYGNGAVTPCQGPYRIIQSGQTGPTDHWIEVVSGVHDLTLGGKIWIDLADYNDSLTKPLLQAPIRIHGGAEAAIHLDGTTTLNTDCINPNTNEDIAGIEVPFNAKLTLDAVIPTGTLRIFTGSGGAGIGGSFYDWSGDPMYRGCGDITINSGIYEIHSSGSAACIGFSGYDPAEVPAITVPPRIQIFGGHLVLSNDGGGACIGGANRVPGTWENGRIEIGGTAYIEAETTTYQEDLGGSAVIGGGEQADGTGLGGSVIFGGSSRVLVHSHTLGAGIGGGSGEDDAVQKFAGNGTGESGKLIFRDQTHVTVISDFGVGIGGGLAAGTASASDYDGCVVHSGGQLLVQDQARLEVTRKDVSTTLKPLRGAAIGGRSISDPNGPGKNAGSLVIEGGNLMLRNNCAGVRQVGLGGWSTGTGPLDYYNGHTEITAVDYALGYTGLFSLRDGYLELLSQNRTPCRKGPTDFASRSGWMVANGPVPMETDKFRGVLIQDLQNVAPDPVTIGFEQNNYTMTGDRILPAGRWMTIPAGKTFTIPAGVTLTVEGRLIIEGTLVNNGSLDTMLSGVILGWDHEHQMSHSEATPGTCIGDDAVPEYWHCSRCGGYFLDEAGTQFVEPKDLFIPGSSGPHSSHHYGTSYTAPAGCESGAIGSTGGVYCDVCDRLLDSSKDVYGAHWFNQADGTCRFCGAARDTTLPTAEIPAVTEVCEGDELVIPISFTNLQNMTMKTLAAGLSYNPAVLEYVRTESCIGYPMVRTSLYDSSDSTYDVCEMLQWEAQGIGSYLPGSGLYARVYFKVLVSNPVGDDGFIQVVQPDPAATGTNGSPVYPDMQRVGGTFRVRPMTDSKRGDVNLDGTIDAGDAQHLARALQLWEGYHAPLLSSDLNWDNLVDLTDLGLLERRLAHYDGIVAAMSANPGRASVALSSASGCTGETVELLLSLTENTGIQMAQLQLDYDPARLELLSAENVSAFSRFLEGNDDPAVPYRLLLGSGTDKPVTTADPLVRLTFRILDDAPGIIPVSVSAADSRALDEQLTPMAVSVLGGEIEVLGTSQSGNFSAAIASQTANTVSIRVTVHGSGTVRVLAAGYNRSTRMQAMTDRTVSLSGSETFTLKLPRSASYRLFLFDSSGSPLCEAKNLS